MLLDGPRARRPVGGGDDRVALALEVGRGRARRSWVVVDDEDRGVGRGMNDHRRARVADNHDAPVTARHRTVVAACESPPHPAGPPGGPPAAPEAGKEDTRCASARSSPRPLTGASALTLLRRRRERRPRGRPAQPRLLRRRRPLPDRRHAHGLLRHRRAGRSPTTRSTTSAPGSTWPRRSRVIATSTAAAGSCTR